MNITDEQLSAFLDAELSNAEMDAIREQLLEDESLADRLAELAMVDELVAASAKQIDARPIPQTITALLQEPSALKEPSAIKEPSASQEQPTTAQIITFPLWKRVQKTLQQPLAVAASVALVIGFGMSQMLNHTSDSNDWPAVAKVLDVAPSGLVQVAANGAEVKPRLSFKNLNGEYCRQFELKNEQGNSENIACRKDGTWQITASVVSQKNQGGDYQTASGGSALDEALEEMIDGDVFNKNAEADAIAKSWLVKP
jgi:negative regulator of sigma E activity